MEYKKNIEQPEKNMQKTMVIKNADHVDSFARDHLSVSADLQKVILLPLMEELKEGIFTPRLVVFKESIATLGQGRYS